MRVVDLGGEVPPGGEDGRDPAAWGVGAGAGVGGGARLVHCFEEHVDGVGTGAGDRDDQGALPVSAVRVSACGKWMASASLSGVVHVFDLSRLRHHWTVPR